MDLPGGGQLYYRLVGTGPDTLVAVPGGPGWSSRYLEEALRPLAARHVLLLYDPRGRGRSPDLPAESLSIAGDVRDLEALRDHFHLSHMKLLGHQYGAGVALLYATAHPERVTRLVFAAPMVREASFIWRLALSRADTAAASRFQRAQAMERTTDPMAYCRAYWGWDLSPAEELDPTVLRRLAPLICDGTPDRLRERGTLARAIMRTNPGWRWGDSLAKVTAPVLVVVGDQRPTLAALAEAWVTPAKDARLLRLSGSGWFPWVEQPERWVADLDRFLAGNWPDSAMIVREVSEPPRAGPAPS
jgi:proline iminopeptidase